MVGESLEMSTKRASGFREERCKSHCFIGLHDLPSFPFKNVIEI